MLTSRGGFCSYWTFLRAVLMLESPSPVFFFFFFFNLEAREGLQSD